MEIDKDNDPLDLMDKVLSDAVTKGKNKHWIGKRYSAFRGGIEIDSRGEVGEKFVSECFRAVGYKVTNNNNTDAQSKEWDITVIDDDIYIEVKTATLGVNKAFQHENIDKNRSYDILLFVDIAPENIYLSWFAKSEIEWDDLHRRRNSIHWKWDFRLSKVVDRVVKSLENFDQSYKQARDTELKARAMKKPKNLR